MNTEKSTPKETFNFSALFFFLLSVGSVFCSLMCLDEAKNTEGILIALYAVAFLLISIWNTRSSFYPVITGLFVYLAFTITLTYYFHKVIMGGVGFLSPYIYLLLGLLSITYFLLHGYQKEKSENAS
jgi:hypothetical protein